MESVTELIWRGVGFVQQGVVQYLTTMIALITHFYEHDILPYFMKMKTKIENIKSQDDLLGDPELLVFLGLTTLAIVILLKILADFLMYVLRGIFSILCCCCRRRKQKLYRPKQSNEGQLSGEDVGMLSHRSGNAAERLKEARRWARQAQQDLNAAKNDLSSTDFVAPEWATLKCQQAAEKALKACLISKDISAVNIRGHDLYDLAALTYDRRLIELAQKIQGIVGFIGRLRYPDYLPYPHVPHDVISEENAEAAIGLCNVLLSSIKEHYTNPESKVESSD